MNGTGEPVKHSEVSAEEPAKKRRRGGRGVEEELDTTEDWDALKLPVLSDKGEDEGVWSDVESVGDEEEELGAGQDWEAEGMPADMSEVGASLVEDLESKLEQLDVEEVEDAEEADAEELREPVDVKKEQAQMREAISVKSEDGVVRKSLMDKPTPFMNTTANQMNLARLLHMHLANTTDRGISIPDFRGFVLEEKPPAEQNWSETASGREETGWKQEDTDENQEETEWKQEETEYMQEETEYKQEETEYKQEETEWKQEETEWKQEETEWKQEKTEWKQEETEWKQEGTEWKQEGTEWNLEGTEWNQEGTEWKREEVEVMQEETQWKQEDEYVDKSSEDHNYEKELDILRGRNAFPTLSRDVIVNDEGSESGTEEQSALELLKEVIEASSDTTVADGYEDSLLLS